MPVDVVILGGGPGGNSAATTAARLGAHVTLVERDIVGGAAHLLDCIPSKAMIATGGAMSFAQRIEGMGLSATAAAIDLDALRDRITGIEDRLQSSVRRAARSQGVRIIQGTGRLKGPHEVVVETATGVEEIDADAVCSRPAAARESPTGRRSTASASSRPARRTRRRRSRRISCVIGSGVTGVEFVHMFSSFG